MTGTIIKRFSLTDLLSIVQDNHSAITPVLNTTTDLENQHKPR